MKVTTIRTSGLGDATYLFTYDGAALIVDPQRDVDRFERALAEAGGRLFHVLETHLHNDYVSGGRALAARNSADLVLPAAAGVAFEHVPAFHHEELDGGPFTIRPIHTPGHTPEHLSYLVLVDGEPVAVFSGGSLLVGSAGRTDLLGMERAEQLARLQYISVNRLAALPGDVGLYPTHGEGSFCSTAGAGRSTSTIALERESNPVLRLDDADAFVQDQLNRLQPFPSYYAHMGPINLMGPEPIPDVDLVELDPTSLPEGVALVDIRPREDYAAGHIPGAMALEEGDRVAVWAGWLLPFDSPIALVANRGQDVAEVAKQFYRIGFDHVVGVIYDLEPWVRAGGELASFETRTAAELSAAWHAERPVQLLDVRAPHEREIAWLEGSIHAYTPDLKETLPSELDPEREVWVACNTGFRAMVAVPYLEERGYRPVVVTKGGIVDVLHEAAAGDAA